MPKTNRTIRLQGDVAYIPLTRGYEATVDAECIPMLVGKPWFARSDSHNTYAARWLPTAEGKRKHEHLHRLIMGNPVGFEVDHINGDGLDNRKQNLRLVTRSQNMCNRPSNKNSLSKYKGVSWAKRNSMWAAKITFEGKEHWLGYHDTELGAYEAYCKASNKLHKHFQNLG